MPDKKLKKQQKIVKTSEKTSKPEDISPRIDASTSDSNTSADRLSGFALKGVDFLRKALQWTDALWQDQKEAEEALKKERALLSGEDPNHLYDAATSVGNLRDELIRPISVAHLARLMAAIEAAQKNPPADKKKFVADVNHLLDTYNFRIRVKNGELYRLCLAPGASGRGYIQFSGAASKGSAGGFRNAEISLEPVSENFNGSRIKSPLPPWPS